ncbi:MAG: M48 family metallopeptidase [Alphaproteobacteria bacterium]
MSKESQTILLVADREVPMTVRRSARARQILLRIDAASGGVVLVLPRRASLAEGLAFAQSKDRWVARRLESLPPSVRFTDGSKIPVLGQTREIVWSPSASRTVSLAGERIETGGPLDTLSPRIEAWLRRLARSRIEGLAGEMALGIGARLGRISIRDTSSRWGSCSRAGNLNFSWRLVLAPQWVLAYVVAHEVAHLKQMNHGKRFWALVEDLVGDPKGPRAWLRAHGAGLHRYG